MNNRSLRYSRLMKAMGIPEQKPADDTSSTLRKPLAPEKIEALSGMEHPEAKEKRRIQALIDAKISELEQSDDPKALETINYWKKEKDKLNNDL